MDKKLNTQLENNISFGGRGKVLFETQEYTEELGLQILARYKGIIGDVAENIKEHLMSKGLLNEDGKFLKRVVIKDGNDYIDESKLKGADFVIQDGGVLDQQVLTANNIAILGGRNIGVNANSRLHLYGEQYTPNPTSAGQITAKDTTIIGKVKCQELITDGNVLNDGYIDALAIKVHGDSHLENIGDTENLEVHGTSSVANIGKVFSVTLNNHSVLNGGANSSIGQLEMTGRSRAYDVDKIVAANLSGMSHLEGIGSVTRSLKLAGHAVAKKINELMKVELLGDSRLYEVNSIKGRLNMSGGAKAKNIGQLQNNLNITDLAEFHGVASEKPVRQAHIKDLQHDSSYSPCKHEGTSQIWGNVVAKVASKLINVDKVRGGVTLENGALMSGVNEVGVGVSMQQAVQMRIVDVHPEALKKICIEFLNDSKKAFSRERLANFEIPSVTGLDTLKDICRIATGNNDIEASDKLYKQMVAKLSKIGLMKVGKNLSVFDNAQVNSDKIYKTVVHGKVIGHDDTPKTSMVYIQNEQDVTARRPMAQIWNTSAEKGYEIEGDNIRLIGETSGRFRSVNGEAILPNVSNMGMSSRLSLPVSRMICAALRGGNPNPGMKI